MQLYQCAVAVAMAMAVAMPLSAQVFIVDAAGGSGSAFTDIQTAVSTVPDGAILRVRAGTYSGFTIDQKSLTVLADAGVVVNAGAAVHNLMAGQQVTVRGIAVGPSFLGGAGIGCSANLGSVLLDSCDLSTTHTPYGGQLTVYSSVDVHVRNCIVTPTINQGTAQVALNVIASRVSFTQCDLLAQSNTSISALYSSLVVADSNVEGTGSLGAVSLFNSSLRGLGATTFAVVGSSAPAITGTGSARLAPTVVLMTQGGLAIAPGVAAVTQDMPVVTAETQPAAGLATASLRGPSGGLGVLFVSLPSLPTMAPGLADPVVLEVGAASSAAAGVLSAPLVASYTVPPLPVSLGIRITWQGVTWDPQQELQISNGASYVHY